MTRTAHLLSVVTILTLVAAPAVAAPAGDARATAGSRIPRYPLWLAKLLAHVGVPGAQALAGFQALTYDPCKAANWLLDAARQHHPFGEYQLIGYYYLVNKEKPDAANLEKFFFWNMHFQTHFPEDGDLTQNLIDMLGFNPAPAAVLLERFKAWDPEKEPPLEPASCPSRKYAS